MVELSWLVVEPWFDDSTVFGVSVGCSLDYVDDIVPKVSHFLG